MKFGYVGSFANRAVMINFSPNTGKPGCTKLGAAQRTLGWLVRGHVKPKSNGGAMVLIRSLTVPRIFK